MAGSKKGRDMADDPDELTPPKINSHYPSSMDMNRPQLNKQLPASTPRRYKSQQARDTKTTIRKGGARGR